MENIKNETVETVENEVENVEVEQVEETKTFTEEEVNKLKQSAEDKVRTEYSKRIKALESELEEFRPKTPTNEEKALQDKIKALEDKEKELEFKERNIKLQDTLKNNGLDGQLAKYLNLQGVEDIESYVGEVSEVLKTQINKSNTYKPNTHKSKDNSITKSQFSKMSYADRLNLFKTNEALYKQLSK
ncbi:hypothetical protein [Clostridium novyi]|uniref:hypothetical protein n=1 Tax=Clostridium novyi TaxID=1542 RepID=UPI00068CB863|nr:hypothetical protein [Clostridium novyi]